jgi:hypothetical protein
MAILAHSGRRFDRNSCWTSVTAHCDEFDDKLPSEHCQTTTTDETELAPEMAQ